MRIARCRSHLVIRACWVGSCVNPLCIVEPRCFALFLPFCVSRFWIRLALIFIPSEQRCGHVMISQHFTAKFWHFFPPGLTHQTAFKACVTSAVFVISTQAHRDSHQPQSIWFAKNLGYCPLNISTSRSNCLHQTTTTKSLDFSKGHVFLPCIYRIKKWQFHFQKFIVGATKTYGLFTFRWGDLGPMQGDMGPLVAPHMKACSFTRIWFLEMQNNQDGQRWTSLTVGPLQIFFGLSKLENNYIHCCFI